MNRVACGLVLACLGLAQVHAFVPHHHHHAADAASHTHGQVAPLDAGPCLTACHPDLVPHDEPVLDTFMSRGLQAVVLPMPLRLAAIPALEAPSQAFGLSIEPRANGPPGTKSSRGPPVSLTA